MKKKHIYYNAYLENALKRKLENKQNYKDLYYTEFLRIKKKLSNEIIERGESLFDIILMSYKKTREEESECFILYIDFDSNYSEGIFNYAYAIRNRDIILSALSLMKIKKFKIVGILKSYEDSCLSEEELKSCVEYEEENLKKEFCSEQFSLGKDILFFNKKTDVFEIISRYMNPINVLCV